MASERGLSTLVHLLRFRTTYHPDQIGYTFLFDSEPAQIERTYAALDCQARSIAAQLQQVARAGDRVLLLCAPGLDYIAAFFGCLYAGTIAVPAYPPNPARLDRTLPRLYAIVRDAQPSVVVTTSDILPALKAVFASDQDFVGLHWVAADVFDSGQADAWEEPAITAETLAFLQYTSGSTSTPKGVMVSHGNLLHNSVLIREAFGHTPESRGMIWLPPYHDMGLIGGIIQPLFVGFPVVLMSPVAFLQRPLRWLQAISHFRATTSGGPNFAYDLCVRKTTPGQRAELDLGCWTLAFNGAEPIRFETLQRFAQAFEPSGFRASSFYPCYGLAESTLIVSGGDRGALPTAVRFAEADLRNDCAVVVAFDTPAGQPLVASGRGLLDQRVLIVEPQVQRARAEGLIGEVWVQGQSVAQGYWKQPDATIETFHARLADTHDGPFLRTGDLGFIHDGTLFVTGRLKDLIIIRGRNYAPQDIEVTVEQSHASLRPGCGAAFSVTVGGEERLVVVNEMDRTAQTIDLVEVVGAIRQQVAQFHQLHVYAAVLIQHGSIPKTSSGKIQRHATREAFLNGSLQVVGEHVASEVAQTVTTPVTRTFLMALAPQERQERLERYLREQVAELVGRDPAHLSDEHSLGSLGLDSLMVIEMQHQIEADLEVVVSLADLVEGPNVAQLAMLLLERLTETPGLLPPPSILHLDEAYPLTDGQHALWLVEQMDPQRGVYNIAGAAQVRFPLDPTMLRRVFDALLVRHPGLRTAIVAVNGVPQQQLIGDRSVPIISMDARTWDEVTLRQCLNAEAIRPFDLSTDSLVRLTLFARADHTTVLLLVVHHLIADFWSLALVVREMIGLYTAEVQQVPLTLPTSTFTYADYVAWQHSLLESSEGERLWGYWQQHLSGAPPINLPLDRLRPPVQTYQGASYTCEIDAAITRRLKIFGEQHQATSFMTVLAALYVLFLRYTGQCDLLLGTVGLGRSRAWLRELVGYIVNPLALRVHINPHADFATLLEQVRQTLLGAFAHQDYPFARLIERLQPERDLSRPMLIHVMVIHQSAPHASPRTLSAFALGLDGMPVDIGGIVIESIGLEQGIAQFDLTVLVAEIDDRLMLSWNYNVDLFDRSTIVRMTDHFHTLLVGLIDSCERPIALVPLLDDAAMASWEDRWGGRAQPFPDDMCLHHLVARQAHATPMSIAVCYGDQQVQYDELDRCSNQMARYLRHLGVDSEVRVALCVERSPAMLIALLGILKAGGVYVPIDPEHPRSRTDLVLEDARPLVLLTQQEVLDRGLVVEHALGEHRSMPRVVLLDTDWSEIARHSAAALASDISPDSLAYIIYTSGSTGRPKGVAIPHWAVVNFLSSMAREPGLNDDDRLLAVTTLSFDIAVLELFLPLVCGACVVLPDRETVMDGRRLLTLIESAGATVMQATPATWWLLLRAGWEGTSRLRALCGGESFPRELANQLLARSASLWNMYGPTETTIWSAIAAVAPGEGPVTIDRPVGNTQIYVLDSHFQIVPSGVSGELYIGGIGLARGYVDQPDLTAERFVPNPFVDDQQRADGPKAMRSSRLYKTGDLVRSLPDGRIEFLGRIDHQVKIRGFRIELTEIETVLRWHPAVQDAVVLAQGGGVNVKRLVGYVVLKHAPDVGAMQVPGAHQPVSTNLASELGTFLKAHLPDYMVPSVFVQIDAIPLTPNGKIDRKSLPQPDGDRLGGVGLSFSPPRSMLERVIAAIWQEVLQVERVNINDNFFDLNGHSLLLAEVQSKLRAVLHRDLAMVDLFKYPTIATLAAYLSQDITDLSSVLSGHQRARIRKSTMMTTDRAVAIIGMSGRFPGASDTATFWRCLCDGVESISFFSKEELVASGVDPLLLQDPNYVPAQGVLEGADLFDAAFFGFNPREAEIMDPQHRVFLECAWHALEDAGYDAQRFSGRIGMFAGVGMNSYLLFADRALLSSAGRYQAFIGNDKDFVPTRVSYKLNLRGPSVNVQTACSSSLVAVHLACQSLLSGECDMALGGGVAISAPLKSGYRYEPGGVASPDGHCRAFDAGAGGTVFGNGLGVVVLKRLDTAIADGDTIHAVIKGSAINNDGGLKVGYTAPSVEGQAEVISEALAVAQVPAESIGYVEAHGTATALGDPIEIAALTQAYRWETDRIGFCAIGSVKTNVGHLDTAAGIVGLIKTTLMLERKQIVPSLHFTQPNPQINFADSPFYVNSQLIDWPVDRYPRRAGVSSFGIGGTNVHVVLEEPSAPLPPAPSRPHQLLLLSARSTTALEQATTNLVAHLKAHPEQALADVSYTLQVGRRVFAHRRALVVSSVEETIRVLEAGDPTRLASAVLEADKQAIVFMFPGQGAQYAGMGQYLYAHERIFQQAVDRCAELMEPHLGLDIREMLYPDLMNTEQSASVESNEQPTSDTGLDQTWLAQPALFVVEYALAQLWQSWGVQPQSLIGHSIGEYVAACLAGVMRLADALALVVVRGRLMQELPSGAMLAVGLSERDLRPLLWTGLDLAAVNAPMACVVAGTHSDVAVLEERLTAQGVTCRRLHTSHAFHSAMVEPIVAQFTARVAQVRLHPPRIPFVSNISGTWITNEQACDPGYWARHLRAPVRFGDGIHTISQVQDTVLLEVGPGFMLSSLARQQPDATLIVSSMRHPQDTQSDQQVALMALGRLWLAGVPIDWSGFYADERRRRVPLPVYPFERQRYWIAANSSQAMAVPDQSEQRLPLDQWCSAPLWRETIAPPPLDLTALAVRATTWLIFADATGIGLQIAALLDRSGQHVVLVHASDGFSRDDAGNYQIDPCNREDYIALIASLREADRAPDTIVHLWSLNEDSSHSPVARAAEAQERGFLSLLFLVQALTTLQIANPLRIGVITDRMHAIAGAPCHPEQATVLGMCRVAPQEHVNQTWHSIDIALSGEVGQISDLADIILSDLVFDSEDTVVAYRGMRRLVQFYEPLSLAAPSGQTARLRDGGVYLITGGLGGIGLTLADYLARTVRAKLVLLGRTALPDRSAWSASLVAHDDATSRLISRLLQLEAAGAEVLPLRADVTDPDQLAAALAAAQERFGVIHGIIHAAGVPGGGMIQARSAAAAREVLAPKVTGTLLLAGLLPDQIDFFLLCSSITAVVGNFGQADYCAANAFLDAFAAGLMCRRRPLAVVVNWDRWEEVGMAVMRQVPELLQMTPLPISVGHPLLDTCLLQTPDRCLYLSEFSVEKHWVLSEHRVAGNATIPGTTYLEMARAGFVHQTGATQAEIRDVVFVAPLIVLDGQCCDVLTVLEHEGTGYHFRVFSKPQQGRGTAAPWHEHVVGWIGPLADPVAHRPMVMNPTTTYQPVSVELPESRNGNSSFLETGPRWDNLRQVMVGQGEGLVVLELDGRFATDLELLHLHPALLDTAAGAVKFIGKGDYLPLTYQRLLIKGRFPRRIKSYLSYRDDEQGRNDATKEMISCDIVITDEDGEELVIIERFNMRRMSEQTIAVLHDRTRLFGEAAMRPSGGLVEPFYDHLVAEHGRAAPTGISPAEGAELFARIIGGANTPQVVVSTIPLGTAIRRARALNSASIAARMETTPVLQSSHPRPQMHNPYIAPVNAIEQQISEVWQRILGIEQIGIHDNFFELGGTSLTGVQVVAELKKVFAVDIPVVRIFEAPTISALAGYLRPEAQEPVTFDHSQERARKKDAAIHRLRGGKR